MAKRDTGGGASDTTEPAMGSSSGTDVPLRAYVEQAFRHVEHEQAQAIESLEKLANQHFDLNDRALAAALLAAKEAVAAALTASKEAVAAALTSAKEAVDKAEAAASKRFESTNEFRAQQADIIAGFPSREVVDAQFAAVAVELDRQRTDLAMLRTQLAEAIAAVRAAAAGEETAKEDRRAERAEETRTVQVRIAVAAVVATLLAAGGAIVVALIVGR